MKDLWLHTVDLLRKHPILWLPYLAADMLSIFLWRLRGVAEKGIFRWFSTSHSVLGGGIAEAVPNPSTSAKASIAYAPVGFTTIFVVVFLFVVALVLTSNIVDAIVHHKKPEARKFMAALEPRSRAILLFSLTFLVAYGVVAAGVTSLEFYLLGAVHRPELIQSAFLLPGLVLVEVGCAAWLVMPMAIRLLQPDATAPIPAQTRIQGTILAILASEVGMALGVAAQKFEAQMILGSRLESIALSALNSILANAPDVLLFIALALLASKFARDAKTPSNPEPDVLPPGLAAE